MAHSQWGASSAHRWMACPGSVALCAPLPNVSSSYAIEGTAAHVLGEKCIRHGERAADHVGTEIEVEGQKVEVTEEMAEAVQVYVDTVCLDRITLGGELVLEQRFDLKEVREGLFGTSDATLITRDDHLIVYDYKHGKGVPVEVQGNKQLRYYSLGALYAVKRNRKIKSVEAVIVQPRCHHADGPVRRTHLDLMDLLDFRADLIAAVEATLAPDAPLRAGEHCKFCPAKATCPEQLRHAQELAAVDFAQFTGGPPAPATLSIDQLAQVLERAELVEDWIGAVRKHVHALLEAGQDVPGWKLVAKRASRYWKDESEAPKALMLLGLGPDEVYEQSLRSPAQVEKFFKGKAAKEALAPLWEKRSSGTTIAAASDTRPAIAPSARSDFAGFISDQSGQE